MTMWRGSLVAAAGVLALLAGPGAAKADDVIRLGGPSTAAKTTTLGFDGQADTELVRGGARGGFGGFRGGGGGFRGGVAVGPRGGFAVAGARGGFAVGPRGGFAIAGARRGVFVGPRGFVGGFNRGFVGFRGGFFGGGYWPYYGGYGYGGYGGYYPYGGYGFNYGAYNYPIYSYSNPYSYYVPPYYLDPSYYYGQPYPGNGAPGVMPYAPISNPGFVAVNGNGGRYVDYYAAQGAPVGGVPAAAPVNGTFPYDGGPANPIPLPAGTPAPTPAPAPAPGAAPAKLPAGKAAPGTLLISYPPQPATAAPARPSTSFAYPAYGEDTRATAFGTQRTAPTTKGSR
jgi:hypothetical protein